MDDFTVDLNLSITKWTSDDGESGYTIYLGEENSSGISVTGSTSKEAIDNLIPYLKDYM